MNRRLYLSLLTVLAQAACSPAMTSGAQPAPRLVAAPAIDSRLTAVVAKEVRQQRACFIAPRADGGRLPGEVYLRVREGGNGRLPSESPERKGFDALVSAGLMTVEESPSQTAAGVSLRRYRLTELGEKYYDHWEEPRVRSSRGFCYGFRTVIQVLNISAISDWGCAKTRSVEYLYRYGGFPEWVEHPAIQQNFPDRLSKVDERVVRHGILSLIKGDEWVAGSYDPIHSNCASIG